MGQQSVATNLLTIMADGMDQCKFRIPRLRQRASKLLQRLFRPTLHVLGLWAHGFAIDLAVSDEDVCKDSETQLEALSRCLSKIHAACGTMPMGLVLQQDNCPREGKNQCVLSYMILLCALNVFRWTVCSYLRVGHRALASSSADVSRSRSGHSRIVSSSLQVTRILIRSSQRRLP